MALASYFERDYETASDAARLAVEEFPFYPTAYRILAVCLGQAGMTIEAAAALKRAVELSPDSEARSLRQTASRSTVLNRTRSFSTDCARPAGGNDRWRSAVNPRITALDGCGNELEAASSLEAVGAASEIAQLCHLGRQMVDVGEAGAAQAIDNVLGLHEAKPRLT